MEKSLGAPLSEHFSEFDPVPIAHASIAQVHNATVRAGGKRVVVKVRTADPATMIGDVVSMLHTTHTLKRLGRANYIT